MKKLKKVFKHRRIVVGLTVVALTIAVLACVRIFLYKDKPVVTSEQINLMLAEASELTTAELNGKGFSEYTDDGIKYINGSNFFMTYEYIVRAGIDMEKVVTKIDEKNKIVTLTVPEAEIFDTKIKPETIKYYCENFAFFNFNSKEDANLAQKSAEDSAKENARETGILKMADNQAEKLIKGIIADAIPDEYEIKIKKAGGNKNAEK